MWHSKNINKEFQSTLSQGERLFATLCSAWRSLFQSTLSQGERHIFLFCPVPFVVISIHALARRATVALEKLEGI